MDLQIKQRLEKEYEDELKDKEYDRMMKEHQKEMAPKEPEKKGHKRVLDQVCNDSCCVDPGFQSGVSL